MWGQSIKNKMLVKFFKGLMISCNMKTDRGSTLPLLLKL
ncbi:hypothetical protein CSB66_1302 [Enterobacter hormaechei]|nr:hypothetical protein CSB66_1302 [Enterobacter hormaechei]